MNNHFSRDKSKKKREKRRVAFKKGQRTFFSGLVATIMVASAAYVWLINDASTQGFVLHGLESQVQELKNENRNLEMEARRKQSLAAVEGRFSQFGLVEATNVEYLSKGPSQVAVNN